MHISHESIFCKWRWQCLKLKMLYLFYIDHGLEESKRSRDTLRFQKNKGSRKFCRLIHKQDRSLTGIILRISLFVMECTIYGFVKTLKLTKNTLWMKRLHITDTILFITRLLYSTYSFTIAIIGFLYLLRSSFCQHTTSTPLGASTSHPTIPFTVGWKG